MLSQWPLSMRWFRGGTEAYFKRFQLVGRGEMVGTMSILFQQNMRASYPSERPAYAGVDYAVAAIWTVGVIAPWLLLLHWWL
jgi:hypothetical protein